MAPVYARLTQMIFGNSIEKSQLHFLELINATDSVLILGGGPGSFLPMLFRQHKYLAVDYIDISPKMLQLAREKITDDSVLNFIQGTELDIPKRTYSVVITYFYLDLFSESTLREVINTIKDSLKPGALWLVADFTDEKPWHRTLLWIMYRFFNLTTHIEAKRLPPWKNCLTQQGGIEYSSKKFYSNFIISSAFRFK